MKVACYSTEAKAERAAVKFRDAFPKRLFSVCPYPGTMLDPQFGYAVAMYTHESVFVAYCARFKSPPKTVARITCYDVGKGQIEIANCEPRKIVTAVRIERSTRKARTDYWFRFNGRNYWGFLGHDGTAFSAKEVKSIPR